MNKPINSLKHLYSGKVRDLYEINADLMLMVASDRLSTFDVILNQVIPDKGKILTQISNFWFDYLKDTTHNHLANFDLNSVLNPDELKYVKNRCVVVKKLQPIPIEAIVRGYLCGSGYKDYVKSGEVGGIKLASGLSINDKLPEPIFTPSTKAEVGMHDENISFEHACGLIGDKLATQVRNLSLAIYNQAATYAKEHGIIIADCKFEFGIDPKTNEVVLMDEVLTPDSSRFIELIPYQKDKTVISFDKQFVRDYLEQTLKWNKQPPIPDLPLKIINKTRDKYLEIAKILGVNVAT